MNIYAIKDTKFGFISVSLESNKAVALRNFADACASEKTMMYHHPEDYEFYELGEFDQDTGLITPKLLFLERATAFVKGTDNGN